LAPIRKIHRGLTFVVVACLIFFSLQPIRPSFMRSQSLGHRTGHAIAFGATAWFLVALSRSRREQWMTAFIVVCVAAGIEILQQLIYTTRHFEWWDFRDDALGVLLAILLVQWARTITSQPVRSH
jgi:cell shape-determining protein MreD